MAVPEFMELVYTAAREGVLLSFLRGELKLSSSLVKRLKWCNGLWVNDQPAHTNYPVRIGDQIVVRLAEAPPDFPPEDDPVQILYEDPCLLALDKPPGLLMHPSFYRQTGTLANRVAGYYRRTSQRCAVHPVSRLDRDTFGVVLLAKNSHIHSKMMEQLQARMIRKTYQALVFGCPSSPDGVWDYPIARKEERSLFRIVHPDGKPAQTYWSVLSCSPLWAQLQLCPVTGRTHQLRVHCAYAGFPILGDPQYNSRHSRELSASYGLSHQQLLASSISFPHPITGQVIHISSRQSLPQALSVKAAEQSACIPE